MSTSKEKEKMEQMEKSMSEDAIWKRIQKNTFTRWANEHLKSVNKCLSDLETDFADGIRFIALVEVLAGKKVPYKYHKRPTMRSHKLENVYTGLKFLTDDEGLRLVNIDSVDVVDSKLKLILGLMWTLILHYSISLPIWEDDAENMLDSSAKTPKQRLLRWIQSKIPDMKVTNFTNDWNDGRAVGALVDALAPGLCPNWQKWDPKNAEQNAKEAMDKASEWLGVPKLVEPNEMINPKVDELSMMTYLSQFPNAKLKDGAPVQMETNPKRVRVYGPGIEPTGVCCGAPTNFQIETFSAGAGDVKVEVTDPKGKALKVDVKFNNDKSKSYTATYTAQLEGPHKVSIKFAGEEIPKAPFPVEVKGFAGDPSKVVCTGPGIKQTGINATKPTFFDIDIKNAGPGQVEVVILDPQGNKDRVPCRLTKTSDTSYKCEYCPTQAGVHNVTVLFCGKPIPKSPFNIRVGPAICARKCRLSGRGLVKRGVRIGDVGDFKMYTENAGEAEPEIEVIAPGFTVEGPSSAKIECTDNGDGSAGVKFNPSAPGDYIVHITTEGEDIPKSPYICIVIPQTDYDPLKIRPKESCDPTKVKVYGPGLEKGVKSKTPTKVHIDSTAAGTAEPEVVLTDALDQPVKAKMKQNDDGTYTVDINAPHPGKHYLTVTQGDQQVIGSPFRIVVAPHIDVSAVKVQRLEPTMFVGTVLDIDVNSSGVEVAPNADVQCRVKAPSGQVRYCQVIKGQNKGEHNVRFMPKEEGEHELHISYDGVPVTDSPFQIMAVKGSDISRIHAYGPGLEIANVGQPNTFTIDLRNAGLGQLGVHISGPTESEVSCTDSKNGTCLIQYIPDTPGEYVVNITFSGEHIKGSPFLVPAGGHVDAKKVKVKNLDEKNIRAGIPFTFIVDCTKAGDKAPLRCEISTDNGPIPEEIIVEDNNDGTYEVIATTPENVQNCTIDLTYGGQRVKGTPINLNLRPKFEPELVQMDASELNVAEVLASLTQHITIDTTGAGEADVEVIVTGPDKVQRKQNIAPTADGKLRADVICDSVGKHTVSVLFGGKDVPGSPIQVKSVKVGEPAKVKFDAEKIKNEKIELNREYCIPVDPREAGGKGAVNCRIVRTGRKEGTTKAETRIEPNKDGTRTIFFSVHEKGEYTIEIRYGGEPVPKGSIKIVVS